MMKLIWFLIAVRNGEWQTEPDFTEPWFAMAPSFVAGSWPRKDRMEGDMSGS